MGCRTNIYVRSSAYFISETNKRMCIRICRINLTLVRVGKTYTTLYKKLESRPVNFLRNSSPYLNLMQSISIKPNASSLHLIFSEMVNI